MVPIEVGGSRSGVNWMRWKLASIACASVFTESVFASPARPRAARGRRQETDQQPVDDVALADDDLADGLAQPIRERRRFLDPLRRGGDACIHGVDSIAAARPERKQRLHLGAGRC
jgi:hypothetical protein